MDKCVSMMYNCANVQMIKGGRAMANMFEKYAADREAEQEQRAEQERAARMAKEEAEKE